jgi:hypothetical protein
MVRIAMCSLLLAFPLIVSARQASGRGGERFTGHYTGSGHWFEDTGKTMSYTVEHVMRLTERGFELNFTHDFADKTQVRAAFEMVWRTPALFDVKIGDATVGHGYCLADACKYHLKTGNAFVEVSYHPTPTGLEVYGSSSANAEGHYIAWHEELRTIQ